MRRRYFIAGALAVLLAFTGCTPSNTTERATPATPTVAPPTVAPTHTITPASPEPGEAVSETTVVRFTSGGAVVDVTIGPDNPTTRDFLSTLPLTLTVEEFAGREKIADLPRTLATAGSPGSDPENGDLIYFIPWGNLGFYYNTDGIGYSELTIHLGTYNATLEQLTLLEGSNVTVELVQ